MRTPVPTIEDVLDALPCLDRPASVVVEAARLYLGAGLPRRRHSTREVGDRLGVAHQTAGYWFRQLGITRSKSEAAVVNEARKRDPSKAAPDELAIRREYQRSEPVDDILARHRLHIDHLYRILRRGGVPLRGQAMRALSERDRLAIERRRLARERAEQLGYVRGTRDTRGIKRQIAQELSVSRRSVEDYLAV